MTPIATAGALDQSAIGGPAHRPIPRGTALVVGLVVGASALLLVTRGDPISASFPLALTVVGYVVLTKPLRWTLFFVMALMILADILVGMPGGTGTWASPVEPLRRLLLENLDKTPGLAALHFAGVEVLIGLLICLALFRVIIGSPVDRSGRHPGCPALYASLVVAVAAVVVMEVWGLAHGGDFRQSLWQFRSILWLPLLTGLALYALRGPRDFTAMAVVFTATACIKVAIGLYFYVVIAHPTGTRPPMVTSHADSLLFVAVMATWIAVAIYRPTRARILIATAVCAWMIVGLIINNRRTAFVGLLASLIVLCAMLPRSVRRRVLRAALYSAPLAAVYLVVGQHSNSGFFAPAVSIMSVSQQTDASSETRDIENYNLVVTIKQHMIAGSGWGHEYVEQIKAYDISHLFEQYRYVAHNSVLWLWSLGGLIGFTALWLPYVVAAYLGTRSNRYAVSPDDRAAGYAVVAVITIFLVQAWSDMGTQGWTSIALLAAAFATSGKLAITTGAWPAPNRGTQEWRR